MKIKISNLSLGTHHFSFSGDVAELELSAPFSGLYAVEIDFEKSNHQMIAHVKGFSGTEPECSRCGVLYSNKVEFDFNLYYMVERLSQTQENIDSDDVIFIAPEIDVIDFAKDVFDYANLALPMKTLCKEDCKGLCTTCGTDLNVEECNCPKENISGNSPFSQLKNLFNNN